MINNKIKLIALDLDGTTLQSDNSLAIKDEIAIKKAIENNINVVIATGRVLSEVPQCILNIKGIDYIISSNGAKVTEKTNNKTIYENCLNDKSVAQILKQITHDNIFFEMYNDNQSYSPKYCYDIVKSYKLPKNLLDFYISKIIFTDNFEKLIKKEKTEKFYIILKNTKQKLYVLNNIKNILDIEITESSSNNMEINKNGVSKAKGLEALCSHLNISLKECAAIGDSLNDYQMLKCVGFPVAMKNAPNQLKEISKLIVSDNFNNGVALAINKLV
ncbi:MAG: Cof-type HAD-IIB family hydrolase [Oscillospiraceae bacterium]